MKKIALFALAFFSLVMGGCAKSKPTQVNKQNTETNQKKETKEMKVTEMNTAMFKNKVMDYEANPQKWDFKGERPAIIDFYATWCGPCKAIAPIMEELANEYDGKVDIYKVDVDKNEELAALFGIRSIPTLLFIPKTGDSTISVGGKGKADLEKIIKDVLLK